MSELRIKQVNYLDTESGSDLVVTSFKNCGMNLVYNSANDKIRDEIIQQFQNHTNKIPPNQAAKPQGTIIVPLHNSKIDSALKGIPQVKTEQQPIGTKPPSVGNHGNKPPGVGNASGSFFYNANQLNGGGKMLNSSASLQLSN